MTRDSFIHLPDDICRSAESFSITRQVEAPSKALQEKRQAWMEDESHYDKPMSDFLLWVQKLANEPHSGLTNRQRREWVRKERRVLIRSFTEEGLVQNVITAYLQCKKRFPEGKLVR